MKLCCLRPSPSIDPSSLANPLYSAINGYNKPILRISRHVSSRRRLPIQCAVRFRPCIDIHRGKVKQIVGSTLSDSKDGSLVTNFESDKSAAEYAKMYKEDELTGGHVIMLGADPLSQATAIEALRAYPGGLQAGGGRPQVRDLTQHLPASPPKPLLYNTLCLTPSILHSSNFLHSELHSTKRSSPAKMATVLATLPAEKPVMLVAVDDSEHSFYALEWTLDHFFVPHAPNFPFDLIVVHAKPSPATSIGYAGPGGVEILPFVDSDLKKIAERVADKAKEFCISKSVSNMVVEVWEGDARNVLCEAVEKHHAAVLMVGNHGYGAIKRAVLGSVSDYCAHHAHCSVMIVKKPKTKH